MKAILVKKVMKMIQMKRQTKMIKPIILINKNRINYKIKNKFLLKLKKMKNRIVLDLKKLKNLLKKKQ